MDTISTHLLRAEALELVLGVLVVASGLAACLLFLPRASRRNLGLLYFGISAAMYGVRMLITTTTVNRLAPGFDLPFRVANVMITALLVVTITLFFIESLSLQRRPLLWWMVAAIGVEGLYYIVARLLHLGGNTPDTVNHVTVLLVFPVLALLFFPRRKPDRDTWVVAAGFGFMMCFVIYVNVSALSDRGSGSDPEYIGFVALLASVGFVAARQTVRNESKLLAIDQELAIARRIQAGLLPDHNAVVPGLTIATRYVPATSVAGDFYDFLVAPHGGLGLLVADVSGHGVPAALSASMVKVAIRTQAERADDPAAVLRGLNEILYGNLQGQFVTAAYLFLDPASGVLAYAGAGHPPLLVWRAGQRRVEAIEENGLFLGAFPGCAYTTLRAEVASGDRFLLYTDGIVEAPSPAGEEFGSERLKEFLAAHCELSASAFCAALMERLDRWCARRTGAEQHDDLTLVVVDLL
jgi:sigma-B regulation protein RsbU (phosphoserine phosphatase)